MLCGRKRGRKSLQAYRTELLVDSIKRRLSESGFDIFIRYEINGENLEEIADEYDLCQEMVRRIAVKAKRKLSFTPEIRRYRTNGSIRKPDTCWLIPEQMPVCVEEEYEIVI